MSYHPEQCPTTLCMSGPNEGHDVRKYLPPLPLTEASCPTALQKQIEHEGVRMGVQNPFRRIVRRAWAEAEMGLALPAEHPAAVDHLEDAGLLLQDVLYGDDARFEDVFDAGVLEAYLGDLKLRQGQFVTKTHMVRQRSLTQLARRLRDAQMPIEARRSFEIRLTTHLLLGRSSLEYYAASAREGRALEKRYWVHNHEGYAIIDDIKVPVSPIIEADRTKTYENTDICSLPLRSLAITALQESRGHVPDRGSAVNDILGMCVREIDGGIRNYERKILNTLTGRAAQKVIDFAKTTSSGR